MSITIRIRSRDGLERLTIPNPNTTTISQLKSLIQSQLQIPIQNQTLSTDKNLLLSKTPQQCSLFTDMSDPTTPISSLNITHGSIIFLFYQGHRDIVSPLPRPPITPAGSFGKNNMTMEQLIAKQMRITRQETPHCGMCSFDRDTANVFQEYVGDVLAFGVKRAGFMYGKVKEEGRVEVDFIYEPPQLGEEERVVLLRDEYEEKLVEAIASGMGMKRVGFIFTRSVGEGKDDKDDELYTMSRFEVKQAVEMQAESGLKEWVTALVKLKVNNDEEGGLPDVHFEAFQMSDMCVRLFKEGWFDFDAEEEGKGRGEKVDRKVSRMKKEVVVAGKDVMEVDNDFFLVLVKIFDHQVSSKLI